MTDAELGQVAAPAAEVYEAFFVPALFGQFAGPILDAAGVGPGHRVLDVACGTGVVTRAAAARVGPGGAVAGLDVNEGMLAVARRSRPGEDAGAAAPVEWRRGEAEALPWPGGTFDRTVSSFALMFFRDRPAAVAEMARVTAPGGRVALTTWAPADRSPGYRDLIDLLDRVVGPAAADALGAPFTLGDEATVRGLLADVLADVTVEEHPGTARFASIDEWLHTEIRGWTLVRMVDDPTYERLLAEAHASLSAYADGAGRVSFPVPALVASGTSPVTTS
jgi:SAM-dependent methyltransferase